MSLSHSHSSQHPLREQRRRRSSQAQGVVRKCTLATGAGAAKAATDRESNRSSSSSGQSQASSTKQLASRAPKGTAANSRNQTPQFGHLPPKASKGSPRGSHTTRQKQAAGSKPRKQRLLQQQSATKKPRSKRQPKQLKPEPGIQRLLSSSDGAEDCSDGGKKSVPPQHAHKMQVTNEHHPEST